MNTFHRSVNGVPVESRSEPGLGDKIAAMAAPIAHAIDKVAGTNISGCVGCGKMKARLNAGTPLGEALKLRLKGQ